MSDVDKILSGEIALVTGASRGIGAAIANELAALGARVIGTATTAAGVDEIDRRLQAGGGAGRILNVVQTDAVDSLVDAIQKEFGTITILVNNAGTAQDQLLMRMKEEEWASVLDVNLSSVFRTSKACLRGMMKLRRGRIINISSIIGLIGNPGQANYAASKAGIIGFGKALAKEVGSRGITVNTIAPGFIETDMTKKLPEAVQQKMLDNIALGKFGAAQDVAHVVAFLASPRAAYITGETIHVNGGMYMP